MKNEIRVDLLITDFEDSPDVITSLLKINPTRTWIKGELRHPTIIKNKENGWVLSSGKSMQDDLDTHISSLINIIKPKLHLLKKIVLEKKCYCEISIAIYFYNNSEEGTPAIHFERNSLEVFNEIGAEIDIDTYILGHVKN